MGFLKRLFLGMLSLLVSLVSAHHGYPLLVLVPAEGVVPTTCANSGKNAQPGRTSRVISRVIWWFAGCPATGHGGCSRSSPTTVSGSSRVVTTSCGTLHRHHQLSTTALLPPIWGPGRFAVDGSTTVSLPGENQPPWWLEKMCFSRGLSPPWGWWEPGED